MEEGLGVRAIICLPPCRILYAAGAASLLRHLNFRRGTEKGVATLTASADTSIFLHAIAELALPRGRNRHLVNSPKRAHALCFPDVLACHLL